MKKENQSLEKALIAYLELLNRGLYFEAHELLEEAWHPLRKAKHPLRNLVKGLINGAISFEHIKRNRTDAKRKALTVIKSFEKHKYLCKKEIIYFKLFKDSCLKIEALKKEFAL